MGQSQMVEGADQLGRRHQSVLARWHGGGAGMRLHAGHCDIEACLAARAGYHADGLAGGFKHGTLLDVGFEVGVERPSAAR